MAPLVPLTFILAYQADLAYGNKLHRILGPTLTNPYMILFNSCVFS